MKASIISKAWEEKLAGSAVALKGSHLPVIGKSKSMAMPNFKGLVQSGPTGKEEPGKC